MLFRSPEEADVEDVEHDSDTENRGRKRPSTPTVPKKTITSSSSSSSQKASIAVQKVGQPGQSGVFKAPVKQMRSKFKKYSKLIGKRRLQSDDDDDDEEEEDEEDDDEYEDSDEDFDEDDDESDEDSDEDEPRSKSKKKQKGQGKKKPAKKQYSKKLYISKEKEQDIIEWLKDNPCLFNKKEPGFMDQAKKNALWATKAESIGLTTKQLTRWFKSTRTSFGKISKEVNKSGSAPAELSDRQNWILTNFEFLAPHIKRMRGRTLGKQVCITIHIFHMFTQYSSHQILVQIPLF